MKILLLLTIAFLTGFYASAAYAGPAYHLVKERHGDISYPVLSDLKNPAVQKAVNSDIAALTPQWHCDTSVGTDYSAISQVQTLDERTFSFTVAYDYSCGGAHPDAYTETHSYDLASGKVLKLEDILDEDFIEDELTTVILKNSKIEDPECLEDYKTAEWDFYYKNGRLVFLPRLAHAIQSCVQDFPIAMKKLRGHLLRR